MVLMEDDFRWAGVEKVGRILRHFIGDRGTYALSFTGKYDVASTGITKYSTSGYLCYMFQMFAMKRSFAVPFFR